MDYSSSYIFIRMSGVKMHYLKTLIRGEFSTFTVVLVYCTSSKKSYHRLPKYAPPFCTLFCRKSGEGAFARIFNLSCIRPSLHSSQSLIRTRLTIYKDNSAAVWKNGSFDEHVPAVRPAVQTSQIQEVQT